MDKQNCEALIGVFAAIISVESKGHEDQARYADHVVASHPFFVNVDDKLYNEMFHRVSFNVKQFGWKRCMVHYAAKLQIEYRESAFLLAIDLALADYRLEKDEMLAIIQLAKCFEFSQQHAMDACRVLLVKSGLSKMNTNLALPKALKSSPEPA